MTMITTERIYQVITGLMSLLPDTKCSCLPDYPDETSSPSPCPLCKAKDLLADFDAEYEMLAELESQEWGNDPQRDLGREGGCYEG